ncbi:hypothetical protein KIL84_000963 [Mauremys mutica]|uniref:Uncharacterized protein n=1 Tax=Mauremys mutica TaxID=74926 RepID=A0A9D4ATA0_9SAUR|nr:hypothetical protein KIL84_000963 [Mauremys mutica]
MYNPSSEPSCHVPATFSGLAGCCHHHPAPAAHPKNRYCSHSCGPTPTTPGSDWGVGDTLGPSSCCSSVAEFSSRAPSRNRCSSQLSTRKGTWTLGKVLNWDRGVPRTNCMPCACLAHGREKPLLPARHIPTCSTRDRLSPPLCHLHYCPIQPMGGGEAPSSMYHSQKGSLLLRKGGT